MYIYVYTYTYIRIYTYIYMYFIISPSWTNCNLNCSHLKNSLPAIIVKYWPHGPSPPFRPSLGNTFALEGFVWNICIYRYITSKNTISSSIVLITLSIFTFIYCRYTQKKQNNIGTWNICGTFWPIQSWKHFSLFWAWYVYICISILYK
jgi:hypothetical protein